MAFPNLVLGQANLYEKPKIEAGVAGLNLYAPHYAGSNEYYNASLALPYAQYRFKHIDMGSSNKLYYSFLEHLELSMSGSIQLPVSTEDEDASRPSEIDDPNAEIVRGKSYRRRGMADRSWVFGLGMKLSWIPNEYLTLEVNNLYNSTIFSGSPNYVGNSYRPRIIWSVLGEDQKLRLRLSYSRKFADLTYQQYYYEVSEDDMLEDRPAYKAKSGLHSETIGGLLFVNLFEKLNVGVSISQTDITRAANVDSPLVVKEKSVSRTIFFAYSIWQSKEMVMRSER